MQYKICPDCGGDDIKSRDMGMQDYDPSSGKMTVHGQAQEFRCPGCGWTALVEDSYNAESQMEDIAGGPIS